MKADLFVAIVAIASVLSMVEAAKESLRQATGRRGRPTWRDLDHYSFEDYVRDFDTVKSPAGSSDYEFRRGIFNAEIARVREHNKKGLSWKEGINQFSAMTREEISRTMGAKMELAATYTPRDKTPRGRSLSSSVPVADLPANVDWRQKNVVTPVKNQGHCGDCWAFSSTQQLETYMAMSTGLLVDLSVQQITACTPNPHECGGFGGCNGGLPQLGWEYVSQQNPIFQEYQYPFMYEYYNYVDPPMNCTTSDIPSKGTGTALGAVTLPSNDYTALMNQIAFYGPTSTLVNGSAMVAYESGIFAGCDLNYNDVDHAVQLVGYGVENGVGYWTIRNSWGPFFGEAGYIRVLRDVNENSYCTVNNYAMCNSTTDDPTNINNNPTTTVCGRCGVLYQNSYPYGAFSNNGMTYQAPPTAAPTPQIVATSSNDDDSVQTTKDIASAILAVAVLILITLGYVAVKVSSAASSKNALSEQKF